MSDILNDFMDKVSVAAADLGKKTEDTIEIQKIKSEIRSLKRANDRDLKDIGRMIYEKYVKGDVLDEEFAEICQAIEKRDEEIEAQEEEIVKIKGE